MKSIRQRIEAHKIFLVLNHIFWGICATRLEVVEDETCETAYTDAKVIGYNPKFFEEMPDIEALFVIAHEVIHVALGHCFRCGGKELDVWQQACDYVANLILVDEGFQMPIGGLFDRKYSGKSADEVYFLLMKDKNIKPKNKKQSSTPTQSQESASGDSFKNGDHGEKQSSTGDEKKSQNSNDGPESLGEELDSVEKLREYRSFGEIRPNNDPEIQSEWKNNTMLAAQQALGRGAMSNSLKRIIQEVCAPEIDFKSLTYMFVQELAPTDYSWRKPNSTYLRMGLYVPSLCELKLGKMYFINDTSGSISDYQLAICQALLRNLMNDMRPELLTVIHCDCQVKNVEEYTEFDLIKINAVGGGGTVYTPAFKKINELDESPAGVIVFTDMDGEFPKEVPDYPVLWISTVKGKKAPFGETIFLDTRTA